jgi:DNA helicase-2/ATP-dependent DNA helicase PcrA
LSSRNSFKSKGQEWRAVFILNVVDGCIPSDLRTRTSQELEEERRLLYFAMISARDHLALIMPQRFLPIGRTRRAIGTSMPQESDSSRQRCCNSLK